MFWDYLRGKMALLPQRRDEREGTRDEGGEVRGKEGEVRGKEGEMSE